MSQDSGNSGKKWAIDRRMVLQAGGLTLALPFLEAMLPSLATAAGSGDPRRFISLYVPSGTYMKRNNGANWHPSAAGALDAANLPVVFSPFAANAKDFSIIRGIQNNVRYQCQGTGGDHSYSVATYLTGTPYTNGSVNSCTMAGSSLDMAMAAKNGWKSYAMSASGYDGFHADSTPFDYSRTISYLNGAQADTFLNPYKLFFSAGLFASLPARSAARARAAAPAQPALVRNKSILDNAVQSIKNLKAKLGTADRQRVEDYYSGLRQLETDLASLYPGGTGTPNPTPAPTPAATPTPPGSTPNPTPSPTPAGASQCVLENAPDQSLNNEDHDGSQANFPARLKAFCDIMVLAFKCNRAQTFSLMFEYENTNRRFLNQIPPSLVYGNANMDVPGSHNDIAHWSDGGAGEEKERINRCISRDRFYMSYVTYLVNALKSATDPSGSPILDNTIIQFGNGLDDGNHNTDGDAVKTGLPMVLAGGRNMINPGNFYVYENNVVADLLYSINSSMGAGLTSFAGSSKLIKL